MGFVLFNTYAGNLRLYMDDFPYLLGEPSLTHNFKEFVTSYTLAHGIYRPFAILYYHFIYTLYEISPVLSHTIPLAIHVATGFGLYIFLKKQGLRIGFAILAGLLWMTHPFAAEQYMWLSANPGTLVNAIFIIQLLIITQNTHFHKTLFMVNMLSLIAIFTYESTFFFFLPLGYYFWIKFPESKKRKGTLTVSLLIPLLLYIMSKFIIQGTDPRPLINSFELLVQQINGAMSTLINVHVNDYYTMRFWLGYQQMGWEVLSRSPIIPIMGIIGTIGAFIMIFCTSPSDHNGHKHPIALWLTALFTSIIPLLANKEFYFGFRSLFLPTLLGMIFFLWIIQKISSGLTHIIISVLGLWMIIAFFLISVASASLYQSQYAKDIETASTISRIIEQELPESTPSSVAVLIKSESFYDSRDRFIHADHLLGCLHHDWSGIPCLSTQTDRVGILAIEHADGRKTIQKGIDFASIMDKHPLLVLRKMPNGSFVIENVQR